MTRPGTENGCSVVICCYTSERWERLSAAISGAARQIRSKDELIVVVDFNDDLLERVAGEFGEVASVIANAQGPGLSGARNTGVDHATSPIVLFLDDDATPDDTWIDDLTAPFADPDIVGVGGRADPEWTGGSPPWWMPTEFLWVVGCSYRGLPENRATIRNPIGCNMAFRRDAIQAVGGFSAALGRVKDKPVGGEETDLAIRVRSTVGGTIVYEPNALVHHAVESRRMTPRYFASRCWFEGRSKAVLARRVGTGDATEAERSYLRTLASGTGMRIVETVRKRRLQPIGQILALGLGLVLTTLGFAVGTVASYTRRGG